MGGACHALLDTPLQDEFLVAGPKAYPQCTLVSQQPLHHPSIKQATVFRRSNLLIRYFEVQLFTDLVLEEMWLHVSSEEGFSAQHLGG